MTRCNSIPFRVAIYLCLVFLLYFSQAMAQSSTQIILLETMDVDVVTDRSHWFKVQLEELGYIQGRTLELTTLKAGGSLERAEILLKNALKNSKPDLVVTNATLASQVAAKILEGTNIAQLFVTVADPVGAGLVERIGVPSGRNITGRVHNISIDTKIKLVLQLIGNKVKSRPIRFGYIHLNYPSAIGDLKRLNAAAEQNDIVFVPYKIEYRYVSEKMDDLLKDLSIGIKQLDGKIDFLWDPLDPFAESTQYHDMIQSDANVPVVFGVNEISARLGALMFVAPEPEADGREVAILADRILKGEKPGSIPVIPPFKFRLGVNLTTAEKMGILVPPDILKLAGKNVYR